MRPACEGQRVAAGPVWMRRTVDRGFESALRAGTPPVAAPQKIVERLKVRARLNRRSRQREISLKRAASTLAMDEARRLGNGGSVASPGVGSQTARM